MRIPNSFISITSDRSNDTGLTSDRFYSSTQTRLKLLGYTAFRNGTVNSRVSGFREITLKYRKMQGQDAFVYVTYFKKDRETGQQVSVISTDAVRIQGVDGDGFVQGSVKIPIRVNAGLLDKSFKQYRDSGLFNRIGRIC